MPKPGRHENTPSSEIANFTDRENQQESFRKHLFSALEPPVLMFYGIGGAGKSWLLKKLRKLVPEDVPTALLDLDRSAVVRTFSDDPVSALFEIRQQLALPTPRFDVALAMLRQKQGRAEDMGILTDLGAELAGAVVPGAATLLKRFSKPLLKRIRGTPIEKFLSKTTGSQLALELRAMSSQEIGERILVYLAEDLRESVGRRLNRAVSAVIFFDTFEALSAGLQNEEHRRQHEQWIIDIASNFDFALIVIAGQNRLTWEDDDPDWAEALEQHLVGGLAKVDAQRFMESCGIHDVPLQEAILSTSREADGGFHCFSLGLCADIVYSERKRGQDPAPDSLRLSPQDWQKLARRFLKSLASGAESRWIERLALTPQFDEAAARESFASGQSAAQDAAWEMLPDYSFVDRLPETGWLSIRSQMRWALENQPLASSRVKEDHVWWIRYWDSRSVNSSNHEASLAWYHRYRIDPDSALAIWSHLAQAARTSVPTRMSEHFRLLEWWEPIGILDAPVTSLEVAQSLVALGIELLHASLGSRSAMVHRTIRCLEAALVFFTESDYPKDWAKIQDELGIAWRLLPTLESRENYRRSAHCHEAALRVYTEQDYPRDWALTMNNLGIIWKRMPGIDWDERVRKAIECFNSSLRVFTELSNPSDWASTQLELGCAWCALLSGGEEARQKAINCLDASLRVYTVEKSPVEWALVQGSLGSAWSMNAGSRDEEQMHRAIAYYENALSVLTESEFPGFWANTQMNLGITWSEVSRTSQNEQKECLLRAAACYQSSMRVYTESELPQMWTRSMVFLSNVWRDIPATNPKERVQNLLRAIEINKKLLSFDDEQGLTSRWVACQMGLGDLWKMIPASDEEERRKTMESAVACYDAACSVSKELEAIDSGRWLLARAQEKLANTLCELPVKNNSERGTNLRRSVQCYQEALRMNAGSVSRYDCDRLSASIQRVRAELDILS